MIKDQRIYDFPSIPHSPLILHIPHSSREIPPSYRDEFLISDDEIEDEQLQLVDHYTEELFSTPDEVQAIFPVSR